MPKKDQILKISQIKEINFIWFSFEWKKIKKENQDDLNYFVNIIFKEKNLQYERKSLKRLFEILWKDFVEKFCNENENNISARKLWFFYEKIFDNEIKFWPIKTTYQKILDENIFYVSKWKKNKKWNLIDNFLWNINWFNPFVKKSNELEKLLNIDYNWEIQKIIDSKTEYLIEKSISFLYLKETKSSYEIEWENYNFNKNQKFLNSLKNIEIAKKLEIKNVIKFHNLIMPNEKKELNIRRFNNYIASWNELMWEILIDYICPKWKDVNFLLQDLLNFYEKNRNNLNPILLASLFSLFLVFIHPFSDWNGRLSRFFFHYILKDLWIWKNVVIPISAYILNNKDEYYLNLDKISKTFWVNINYFLDKNWEIKINWESKENYFNWDYSDIIFYFAKILKESLEKNFKQEIDFLENFYKFLEAIDDNFDLLEKEKNYIWKFIVEWKWKISKNKQDFLEKKWFIFNKEKINWIEKLYKKYFN